MNAILKATYCTICQSEDLCTVLDLGQQPPANRFVSEENKHELQITYPLAFGYCADCGIMQLTQRIPFDAIRPRYDWLTYSEPEGHLDDAVKEWVNLPGINNHSKCLGVTYKDQSTLDRLVKLGLSNVACIKAADLDIQHTYFGLETIQEILRNKNQINKLKEKYGKADILLMRHIIEHSDHAIELLLSVKNLLNNNGYLILELPDNENMLNVHNHAFIWEEHISYFTEDSLKLMAEKIGAEISWFKRFSYPYEDSLLVAFRFDISNNNQNNKKIKNLQFDIKRLNLFKDKFNLKKIEWHNILNQYIKQGNKIAVFGAGHLSAKLINFFDLKDLIYCVIDDHSKKVGMKMPGSLLPILPSSTLIEKNIKICISTLSPESEMKVKQKLQLYFDEGGLFLPAFTIINKLKQTNE